MSVPTSSSKDGSSKPSNWRTAMVLLSVAAVFFIGIIINQWMTSQL